MTNIILGRSNHSLFLIKAASKAAMKHSDTLGAGAKKRKKLKGKAKFDTVMAEYGRGTLHSSSGEKVTSQEQAVAIAFSEAGMSRPKKAKKAKKTKKTKE